MHELRRYPSLPHAWSAAAYLRAEGILARGYQRETGPVRLGILGALTEYAYWVAVAFETDLVAGGELLDEFDRMPAEESDWQDQTEPNLGRLAPDLKIPCEWCKRDLRHAITHHTKADQPVHCPACGRDNDPVARVIAAHGPEALSDCYPPAEDPDWIDEQTLLGMRIPCQHCRYTLRGLPAVGRCPECARDYDKRAIVERSFLGIRP